MVLDRLLVVQIVFGCFSGGTYSTGRVVMVVVQDGMMTWRLQFLFFAKLEKEPT